MGQLSVDNLLWLIKQTTTLPTSDGPLIKGSGWLKNGRLLLQPQQTFARIQDWAKSMFPEGTGLTTSAQAARLLATAPGAMTDSGRNSHKIKIGKTTRRLWDIPADALDQVEWINRPAISITDIRNADGYDPPLMLGQVFIGDHPRFQARLSWTKQDGWLINIPETGATLAVAKITNWNQVIPEVEKAIWKAAPGTDTIMYLDQICDHVGPVEHLTATLRRELASDDAAERKASWKKYQKLLSAAGLNAHYILRLAINAI